MEHDKRHANSDWIVFFTWSRGWPREVLHIRQQLCKKNRLSIHIIDVSAWGVSTTLLIEAKIFSFTCGSLDGRVELKTSHKKLFQFRVRRNPKDKLNTSRSMKLHHALLAFILAVPLVCADEMEGIDYDTRALGKVKKCRDRCESRRSCSDMDSSSEDNCKDNCKQVCKSKYGKSSRRCNTSSERSCFNSCKKSASCSDSSDEKACKRSCRDDCC
uniref:Uncharacterized protein n=1 Tax=Odontella aurita TaxID=265563 RepID=A0A7S4N4R0_9STRA|mmetsp:Transcript_46849/g.141919  ORF Transcript_46849/g.141919 Transcript_46849/m.141919 type:complete len:215 (+) Transcript_46849:116-760(+)